MNSSLKLSLISCLSASLSLQAKEADHSMLLFPNKNKDERNTLLAKTHRIKGNNQEVNKQGPVEFPFLSIYKGKENNPFAYYTEYRPKLDRFYARQGEYFLKNRDKVRPLIPGFPDLDGGIHGHADRQKHPFFRLPIQFCKTSGR